MCAMAFLTRAFLSSFDNIFYNSTIENSFGFGRRHFFKPTPSSEEPFPRDLTLQSETFGHASIGRVPLIYPLHPRDEAGRECR